MKMALVIVQAAALVLLAVIGAHGEDTERAACPSNVTGAYCDR